MLCNMSPQRPLKPAVKMAFQRRACQCHSHVPHYNKTTTPIIPTTAAAAAAPAGFSAPPLKVVFGWVTDFVGDPDAVVIEMVEVVAVPFADRVGAVSLSDIDEVAIFAGPVTKPVLAIALDEDVGTGVVFEEVIVGAA